MVIFVPFCSIVLFCKKKIIFISLSKTFRDIRNILFYGNAFTLKNPFNSSINNESNSANCCHVQYLQPLVHSKIFLFYLEFYFIFYIRQDSWPYACKSDEEKARKEMSATNVSYYSFWNTKTLIVKVRKLKQLSETLIGLSYTLLDQVFSSISMDQDFYKKVIPGVGFQSPLLVWIKIFPRNLV